MPQKTLWNPKEIILPLFLWHFWPAWGSSEFTFRFQKNTTFLLSKKVALFGEEVAIFGGKLMCCFRYHQPKIANNHIISSSLMYMCNCWPILLRNWTMFSFQSVSFQSWLQNILLLFIDIMQIMRNARTLLQYLTKTNRFWIELKTRITIKILFTWCFDSPLYFVGLIS